jgi:hypothetical protein
MLVVSLNKLARCNANMIDKGRDINKVSPVRACLIIEGATEKFLKHKMSLESIFIKNIGF